MPLSRTLLAAIFLANAIAMPSTTPRQFYESRRAELTTQLEEFDRRDGQLAAARGVVILIALVMAWAVINPDRLAIQWGAVPVVCFVALVIMHERLARQRSRRQAALNFYHRGLARMDDAWAGTGPTGDDFTDSEHPYAADLDIFGEASLFQLLCAAQTLSGRRRLGRWLLGPASPEVVRERQAAVAELAPRTTLREDLATLSLDVARRARPGSLRDWAEGRQEIDTPRKLRLAAAAVAGLTVMLAIAMLAGWLSRYWLVGAVILQGVFALRTRAAVERVAESVDAARRELDLLGGLLTRFEGEEFQSKLLRDLVARLRCDDELPSRQILRLRRLVDLLDARRNQFFSPFAALLLWGTQYCRLHRAVATSSRKHRR